MDLSVSAHVPWVGIGIGVALAAASLWIAVTHVFRELRPGTRTFPWGPYVAAALVGLALTAAAVGVDFMLWHSEGDGPVGTLRQEVSRTYGVDLSASDAASLLDGEVLLLETGDDTVVVRLEGDELLTVGDWVPYTD